MHDPASLRRSYPASATISELPMRDGWPLRRFSWGADAVSPRGTLLFLGGRGDIFEKYLEALSEWHDAGWAIESVDWRGQGGSGRLSSNPMTGHADSFQPWLDDLAEVFDRLKASSPPPLVVVAHSMGGHLVLRALQEKRIDPVAVALTAPMLGIKTAPFGPWLAPRLAALLARLVPSHRPAWKSNEKPAMPWETRQKLLTHSRERYLDELWWKETNPAIAIGPPSWQWVAEAYSSTALTFAPGRMESVTTPILLIGTSQDGLVDPAAITAAAHRLPHARLAMFGAESAHEILREADPVRRQAMDMIARFLDAEAPPIRTPAG